MSDALNDQTTAIRLSLQAIESQIAAGKVAPGSIGDFKSAVDDIRLQIWATMAAQNLSDGRAALKRFRIRRAAEVLRKVTEDLEDPATTLRGKEIDQLTDVARRLLNQAELHRLRTT